jgi:hypothetical protein
MGVELTGGGPSLNWEACQYCLATATRFGWKPEGTLALHYDKDVQKEWPIPAEEWSGTYFSNEGQAVSDSDARNLAAALDRAIDSKDNAGADCGLVRKLADRARQGRFLIF